MIMFLQEWLFAIAMLSVFALAGGFILTPFRGRYLFLAAPLAGIALQGIAIAPLYGVLKLPFPFAALLVLVICSGLTIACVALKRPCFSGAIGPALCAVAVAGFSVLLNEQASIALGSPAITYFVGTDHAGYAHLADWLQARSFTGPPTASPDLPYESWPAVIFAIDPRFGSFSFLGVVSMCRGLPGLFAYDIGLTIALSAGALGVAAVFGRSPMTLGLLLGALLMSHWYDYGHSGFLGKLLAYPAALLLCGLFLSPSQSPFRLFALPILAAGVASLHSGLATALIVTVPVGIYMLCRMATELQWRLLSDEIVALGLSIFAAIATTGILTRPTVFGYPEPNVAGWVPALIRMMEIESQAFGLPGYDTAPLHALALVVWAALLAIALARRNWRSTALLGGPLVLLVALFLTNAIGVAFQLIGIFHPLVLSGAAVLYDDNKIGLRRSALVVLALLVSATALRVPRFFYSSKYYGFSTPDRHRYSLAQIDSITSALKGASVLVDLTEPHLGLVALVELYRRGVPVQWTDRGWRTVLAYRPWAPPQYASPAPFVLVSAAAPGPAGREIVRTPNLVLIER